MIDLPTALSAEPRWGRALQSHVHRPKEPKPLDPVVLGTKPAPIDNDTHADCCILLAVLAKTQPRRVAEFFALTGDAHEKVAFLLRHAHFDLARGKQ